MISVSRLLCDEIGPGDHLRYPQEETTIGMPNLPVMVWNCTERCNLNCIHCYANAGKQNSEQEMSTEQARAFIKQVERALQQMRVS